jgi:hypothetical protein
MTIRMTELRLGLLGLMMVAAACSSGSAAEETGIEAGGGDATTDRNPADVTSSGDLISGGNDSSSVSDVASPTDGASSDAANDSGTVLDATPDVADSGTVCPLCFADSSTPVCVPSSGGAGYCCSYLDESPDCGSVLYYDCTPPDSHCVPTSGSGYSCCTTDSSPPPPNDAGKDVVEEPPPKDSGSEASPMDAAEEPPPPTCIDLGQDDNVCDPVGIPNGSEWVCPSGPSPTIWMDYMDGTCANLTGNLGDGSTWCCF